MTNARIKWLLLVLNSVLVIWCSLLTWQQFMVRHDIVRLSVRSLFESFMAEQAAGTDKALLEARTAAYSQELDALLGQLSKRENIIILVSEAVLSDHVVDITPDIEAALKQRLARRGTKPELRQEVQGHD